MTGPEALPAFAQYVVARRGARPALHAQLCFAYDATIAGGAGRPTAVVFGSRAAALAAAELLGEALGEPGEWAPRKLRAENL